MATGMYMYGSIPRSSSTSDLFDASIPHNVNSRRRKAGSGLKNSFSSFDVWSIPASSPTEATSSSSAASIRSTTTTRTARRHQPPPPRPLTPYQLQRKQMKSSFQFPNGENFTPRNKRMTKSSSAIQLATPAVHQQAPIQLPPPSRAQTLNGFRAGRNFTMDGMPRSQSLTSLSPQRTNTPWKNNLLGSHPGIYPFANSNSTETTLSSNGSSRSIRNGVRTSSGSVQSRPTTVSTPDREVAPSFKPFLPTVEPGDSPPKSLGSSNDEDFQSARGSLIEEEQESPQLEPRLSLQVGLEPEQIADDQLDDELSIYQDEVPVQAPEPKPEPVPEPLKKREVREPSVKEHVTRQTVQQLSPLASNDDKVSRKSKVGKFFRRILHNSTPNALRKRKRNQTPSSSSSGSPVIAPLHKARHRNVSVTDEGSPLPSIKSSSVQKTRSNPRQQQKQKQDTRNSRNDTETSFNDTTDKCRQSSLTPSLEAEEDVLMDTDLVFDSLLLKADSNHPSTWNRQRDLQLKLQTLASPKKSPTDEKEGESFSSNSNSLVTRQTDDDESNVDYELIQEFSKLGNYIEGPSNAIEQNKALKNQEIPPSTDLPHTTLPPRRSPRRPNLPNKSLVQSFYGHDDSNTRIIKRLQKNWDNVHFDSAPPLTTNGGAREKSLRFAQDVYVKDTWSPVEYFRSDKLFIKERRRMMQLENSGFVNSIKRELNEYKRDEMAVHIDSAKFTHFFV
ncbi:hypothetical protein ZYGR_0H03190 [Zygosaccharomyces rouxii]|uniref:Uncharacterized protein n=1 Tax=Zygosaccharomyces rouxii TaxID=4956 RepID=A0A1Q2ZVB9_ZYGRO|nr:hypothetical protein ZYGR_0H03190 [Zygosaccharomyces rouxii]